MKSIPSLMAAMAITLAAAQAHAATATIRLDNSPNGGSIANTGTNNVVTVQVKFCGSAYWTTIGSRALPSVSGQHDFSWTETPTTTYGHVYEVRVSINGGDWFWLDQVELLRDGGQRVLAMGIDNMNGWCLSTDNPDGDNSICNPNAWPPDDTSNPDVILDDIASPVCGNPS